MEVRLLEARYKKKGIAAHLPRRHTKLLRDNILGITKPAIRRLARRGGVVRMKADIYPTIRQVVYLRLQEMMKQLVAVLVSSDTPGHARKTITSLDVVYVLKRMGTPIYGFDNMKYWR
ncbi:hypothetical protein FQN57_003250 [Myotisia sp. PD_48]|nr:hypothetical protein FQN57_003250 [Myotisia sp. PD_48]